MRSFATFVSSIARRLCLRDASTSIFTVYFAFAMSLAGCGGSTQGTVQTQPIPQSISFTQPVSPVTYGAAPITLSATGGGSGNSVVFTVDASSTATGTISSSNVLTFTRVGNLVIDANQAGNADYSAAPEVQRTIVVGQATPTVSTLPTASAITSGQTLASSTLSGGAGSIPGAFAWTTPSTVPAVGTDAESVTFTPTDATDYAKVIVSVPIIVNPAVPTITAFTPRYTVCDTQCNFVNYTVTGLDFENGDIVHDASGLFNDIPLVLASGATSYGLTYQWQLPGSFQPWFETVEMQHPGGPYGNQASIAFLGSGSQSTLAISATTGTLFQVEQEIGQVYWQKTDGTTGTLFSGGSTSTPTDIVVDNTTGNVVYLATGTSTVTPGIVVYDETGDSGFGLCYIEPTGMSFISSIAAKGGYVVFTDPVENLVGIASLANCSGYQTISYSTVSIAGQPWSVVMTNGAELDAHVLSRDKCANGIPCLTKLGIPSGTVEGSVDLTGITPVSTIRATTPYEGLYSVQAFSLSPTAAVLFMSDQTDGTVLTINTTTSGGTKMKVSYTTPITDLPIGIAAQETASSSTLWVAYIAADTMDTVTHVGALDPTTGDYTPAIGECQTGILAGGFIATSNGVYCAQGSVIESPLVLQP